MEDRRKKQRSNEFEVVPLGEAFKRDPRLQRQAVKEATTQNRLLGRRTVISGLIGIVGIVMGIKSSFFYTPEQTEQQVVDEQTEEQAPQKEMPKRLKSADELVEMIKKQPKLLIELLNDPDLIKHYLPKRNARTAQRLINILKGNIEAKWAKKGIKKLKNDIRKGNFTFPNGLIELLIFKNEYFPDIPDNTAEKLIEITSSFN